MFKWVATLLLSFFLVTKTFSQVSSLEKVSLKGKWAVCTALSFSSDYNCDSGWVTYEFFENGTYKDPRRAVYGDEVHLYSTGKWEITGDSLIIDEDDNEYSKTLPRVYKIAVIDKDKFYHVGQEKDKSVTVYTYFQRVR